MSNKVYFSNLDSLRTIAFLLVFFEHNLWPAVKYIDTGSEFLNHVLFSVFCSGAGHGVSIFYVLSGFLITYLLLMEYEQKGTINLRAFYTRRVLRIWPLYFALILVVFGIIPLISHLIHNNVVNPANIWYYVGFVSNFDVIRLSQEGKQIFMQSSITWSVSIEEQFYVVWPLLFVLLPKRFFPAIFISFISIGLLFRSLHHTEVTYIYFHTLGNCADLAVGGLLAWLALNCKKFLYRFEEMNKRVIVLVYLLGIAYILLHEYYLVFPYANVMGRFLLSLFFGFIIVTQNFSKNLPLQLGKWRFFNWSGKYTYGLYLLHPIAYYVVKAFIDLANIEFEGFVTKLLVGLVTLVIAYFIAIFSYHFFEQRFLKLKSRFTQVKA